MSDDTKLAAVRLFGATTAAPLLINQIGLGTSPQNTFGSTEIDSLVDDWLSEPFESSTLNRYLAMRGVVALGRPFADAIFENRNLPSVLGEDAIARVQTVAEEVGNDYSDTARTFDDLDVSTQEEFMGVEKVECEPFDIGCSTADDALLATVISPKLAWQDHNLTDPQLWPKLFPGFWQSVGMVAPWKTTPGADANLHSLEATIREKVQSYLPGQPWSVDLDVARVEFRESATDRRLRVVTLAYELPTNYYHPHVATDCGSITLLNTSWPLKECSDCWMAVITKRVEFRNGVLDAWLSAVCPIWQDELKKKFGP